MTSEPDSKPGRRPPTIELKATEVENPAPAQNTGPAEPTGAAVHELTAEPSSAAPSSGRSRSRLKFYAFGASASALAVIAVAAGLWATGYLPTGSAIAPAETPAPRAGVSSPTIDGEITARLDKIERAVPAQHQELQHQEPAGHLAAGLGNRLAAAEAQTKSSSISLRHRTARIDDLAAASRSAARQAGAAATAADAAKQAAQDAARDTQKSAGQGGVQQSDIDAVTNRIAALENVVKALAEGGRGWRTTNDRRRD